MKKNLIKFLTLLLAALLPAIALLGIGIFTPAQYGKTFLGALAPKFARLTTLDEPKIVVVGGSSAAFGLDSALLPRRSACRWSISAFMLRSALS